MGGMHDGSSYHRQSQEVEITGAVVLDKIRSEGGRRVVITDDGTASPTARKVNLVGPYELGAGRIEGKKGESDPEMIVKRLCAGCSGTVRDLLACGASAKSISTIDGGYGCVDQSSVNLAKKCSTLGLQEVDKGLNNRV